MSVENSLDLDPPPFVLRRLWNDYGQDAVDEFGFDGILINARRKRECAVELPNRSLGDPVLGTSRGRCAAGFLGDLSAARVVVLGWSFVGVVICIFDRDLVAGVRVGDVAGDAALSLVGALGGIVALDVALDD